MNELCLTGEMAATIVKHLLRDITGPCRQPGCSQSRCHFQLKWPLYDGFIVSLTEAAFVVCLSVPVQYQDSSQKLCKKMRDPFAKEEKKWTVKGEITE